jgi:hypothetical protein
MEDDLKILKVQYLNNHLLDLPQLLNIRLRTISKLKITVNEESLSMEDDLKIWKGEYASNHWLDLPETLV